MSLVTWCSFHFSLRTMNSSTTPLLALGVLLLSGCGGAEAEYPGPPATDVKQESVPTNPPPPPERPAPAPVPEALRKFCVRPRSIGAPGETVPGSPVPFQHVPSGNHFNPVEPLRCVVRTMEEWERLRGGSPSGEIESVTPELFVDGMLLVATMGEQVTGGFSISIRSVDLRGGEIVVTVRSYESPDGEPVTMGFEYPLSLVRVAKSSAPVRFHEQ